MDLRADLDVVLKETEDRIIALEAEQSCAEDDYYVECRAKIDALTEMRDKLNVLLGRSICPDCAAKIGEKHQAGCDVARCPRCGGQALACGCIYEVCGIDCETMETAHPTLYAEGPTDEMYEKWDAEWADRSSVWTGMWPGVEECRTYNLWSRMVPGRGWVPCDKDDDDATEDLNTLMVRGRWNVATQKMVIPS